MGNVTKCSFLESRTPPSYQTTSKWLQPTEEHRKMPITSVFLSKSIGLAIVTSDNTAKNTIRGSEEHSQITTFTSAQYKAVVSLRTVLAWLKANGKKIKVNAILDNASTVSYVNEEVAVALGLSVTYEKVSVNVLSENVETLDSIPVSFTLEGCDGNLNVPFKALTCPRTISLTGKSTKTVGLT